MSEPWIIAELGSSPAPFTKDRLESFLDDAWLANADSVKIQLFRAEHFPNEERAAKQKLEFPRELFEWFITRARFYKFRVGASVFDMDAIDLCMRLGADFIKLATREQYNWALRESCQRFKGPILRSVNFDTLDQYEKRLPREVTLGCIPRYPTTMTRSLWKQLGEKLYYHYLPEPWGWSSHTVGFDDVALAVDAGAKVIEKHLKQSENDIEAPWSLTWDQFRLMERMIRCL